MFLKKFWYNYYLLFESIVIFLYCPIYGTIVSFMVRGYQMLQKAELQVLDYLTLAKEPVFVSQIARDIGLGKSSVSRALRTLKKYSFFKYLKQGNAVYCQLNRQSPVIAKFRVALNLIDIEPRLTPLKKIADKIVLFGSCSQGTDTLESDIDLLVIARDKTKAIKITQGIKLSRKAQWVIKTPQEYIVISNKEPVFAEELGHGIALWESDEITS
jgi:DNA-binding transcriptional ArsR family regulator